MSIADNNSDFSARLRTNPRAAVTDLFHAHFSMMVHAAARIVQDGTVAEDLVQDIFIKLYEQAATLEIRGSVGAYLRRMAVNKAIDHYRKESKRHKVDIDQQFDLSAREEADQDLDLADTKAAIKAAIASLPQQCRVVFLLKRKEHMTNKEVAEYLGISVKTVENQVTKAMKRLRAQLGPLLSIILISNLITEFFNGL